MPENDEIDDEIKARVRECEDRVNRAQKVLRIALQELDEARIAAGEFQVGDIVLAKRGSLDPYEEAIVRRIEPRSWGNWYCCSFKLRNGTWGQPRRIFNDIRKVGEEEGT